MLSDRHAFINLLNVATAILYVKQWCYKVLDKLYANLKRGFLACNTSVSNATKVEERKKKYELCVILYVYCWRIYNFKL